MWLVDDFASMTLLAIGRIVDEGNRRVELWVEVPLVTIIKSSFDIECILYILVIFVAFVMFGLKHD